MSLEYNDVENVPQQVIDERIQSLRAAMGEKADSQSDSDLQRFLIARKYNLENAKEMLNAYLDWRVEKDMDNLPIPGDVEGAPYLMHLRKYKNLSDVNYTVDQENLPEQFAKFYPAYGGAGFHGVDKIGRPIYIARIGATKVRKLAELCTPETMEEYQIVAHEFVYRKVFKEAADMKGEPVEQMAVIFDCSGMGISQFHIPGIMLLKVLADMNQAYFPERLGRLYVVNAPIFFNAAWAIIKLWLDKRIIEKVFVLGSDYKKVLNEHIEHDQLPSFLGGSCTCSHMEGGCCPSIEELMNCKEVDPDAHRFTMDLYKSKNEHAHRLVIEQSGTINFRFDSSASFTMEICDEEEEVMYTVEKDSASGSFEAEPGIYNFIWRSDNLSSFRSTTLNYTVEHLPNEEVSPTDSATEVEDRRKGRERLVNDMTRLRV